MKNFSFEHEGKTLWYSRSVACTMYLFVYEKCDGKWYVLVSQRGHGCPSAHGLWNAPGGYLDFDELPETAARRECFEETGIYFSGNLHLTAISTNLLSKSQNVVLSYYGIVEVGDKREITSCFSTEHCESDEVSSIQLLDMDMLMTRPFDYANTFAFGHDHMIREIFTKRINCSWWKRLIIRLGERFSKIEASIS